eukprot:2770152-Prymnesium_polylepis.1
MGPAAVEALPSLLAEARHVGVDEVVGVVWVEAHLQVANAFVESSLRPELLPLWPPAAFGALQALPPSTAGRCPSSRRSSCQ